MKMKTNSITVKAVLIAVLVLLMLIPVGMVKSLIEERNNNNLAVKEEIGRNWGGGQQRLTGTVVVLPYLTTSSNGKDKIMNYAYFLPEDYNIDGNIKPEERTRGIYNVLCYQTNLNLKGKFGFPDHEKLGIKTEQIQWDKAFLIVGITYMQGIKNQVELTVNNTTFKPLQAFPQNLQITGLFFPFPLNMEDPHESYDFDINLVLNGTEILSFVPTGKNTQVRVHSDWNSVSFTGNFLPDKREIGQTGFKAEWNMYSYNSNYSQMWIGINKGLEESAIGVNLIRPIDQYQMNIRSAKYAVLFIALTFLIFFLVELISHKRIHPFQYLLVSFALVLFYCLLLAFSEHIGFNWAYLVSAAAIIALITAYSKTVFKGIKQTAIMAVFLLALYTFLYVLLQLEDMALLVGSIGLFIALAAVMYASRKVNWYKEHEE